MRWPFLTTAASRRAVSFSAPVLTYTSEWNASGVVMPMNSCVYAA
jgi:hypothetical protein